MKQVKANKNKVWRSSYGKPFLAKRAMCLAQMSIISSQGVQQLSIIQSSFTPLEMSLVQKAIAIAELTVNISKAIANKSHEMNRGFAR